MYCFTMTHATFRFFCPQLGGQEGDSREAKGGWGEAVLVSMPEGFMQQTFLVMFTPSLGTS